MSILCTKTDLIGPYSILSSQLRNTIQIDILMLTNKSSRKSAKQHYVFTVYALHISLRKKCHKKKTRGTKSKIKCSVLFC